jgi:cytochrome b pre-mRNA-processing protein 3
MDRSLREMGAGDLAVPKKVQKMGSIFYGLLNAMNDALDHDDVAQLTAVMERNIYGSVAVPEARKLAEYLEAESRRLDLQPVDTIVGGALVMGEAA